MAPIWIVVTTMLYFQEMIAAVANPNSDPQNQELLAATIFQKECPSSQCSSDGPPVRYPLHLRNKPNKCSNGDLALSCSGDTTVVNLLSGTYNITRIIYESSEIFIPFKPWGTCLRPDNITLPTTWGTPFYYDNATSHVWLNCSTMLSGPADVMVMGPISCLSEEGNFVYLVFWDAGMGEEFDKCIKWTNSSNLDWFSQDVLEISLKWNTSGIPGNCFDCEPLTEETHCGLWLDKNRTFCFQPGIMYHGDHSHRTLMRISAIAGSIVGFAMVICVPVFFLIYLKHKKTKEVRLKVEQFIKSYNATNPTRYSYGEIIKITKRFNTKLGQGGFGAVFKGALHNGIPVAVKILQISASNGEEFINEVSTIGKIHHIHVVRLLGYCYEGTRRALVYELMENGSLDKYIFYKQLGQIRQRKFNLEALQNMVLGIAEGIEYLHQGCSQRIVHLDIKPHNILLDHNFTPKISDFGLSKICPKDQSYVTVSAAKGTLSYMAPEMYSRNFGTVSYKSDVYSFGMLILEMVSGRRNADPLTGNQSDVYFPELIHEKLIQGQDLSMILDSQSNDVIGRKLVTVALWCIQWNPTDRPTMTSVVNMLNGDVESLPVPPKPSISSTN